MVAVSVLIPTSELNSDSIKPFAASRLLGVSRRRATLSDQQCLLRPTVMAILPGTTPRLPTEFNAQ